MVGSLNRMQQIKILFLNFRGQDQFAKLLFTLNFNSEIFFYELLFADLFNERMILSGIRFL